MSINELFIVVGAVNIGDMAEFWIVGAFVDFKTADAYAAQCKLAATERYNSELKKGFEPTDCICVQTHYDPKAKYSRYHKEQDNTYSIDTTYFVVESHLIKDQMHSVLKFPVKLGKSVHWPDDDSEPHLEPEPPTLNSEALNGY